MAPPTTTQDLASERARATFNPELITYMLDGGPDRTARRRQLEALVANDPTGIFSNEDNPYLHRTQRHVRALAKSVRMIELCRALGIGSKHNGHILLDEEFVAVWAALADDLPTTLHWAMFVPNIVSLCDEEQQARWVPLCRDWRMIGCYAQTEMGHGSNVRGLETTATFLPESKGGMKGGSWVINSPTITSTKFWPGTLGRTANHAMVIARLIDGDGVDHGIHNFLVQLRSMEDHKPMKGVTVGDIGPKIGYNNMDNGFAQFDHVEIPRRNMAMRFAVVNEAGKYTKKSVSDATEKVAYITMMQVRAYIINDAGRYLAPACIVSIRYSAIRRQGFDSDRGDGSERQILDYRQQQHRLLPLLAATYCFFFTGRRILNRLKAIEERLISGKGTVSKAEVSDIHASTSALKSFTTTVAADGIEDCRRACGGHGFLQCSGLPELSTTNLQNPTVEGDNHMLPQQAARVLLKLVQSVSESDDDALKSFEGCDCHYLIAPLKLMMGSGYDDSRETCEAKSEESMIDLRVMLSAYRHQAARLLLETAAMVQGAMEAGSSMQTAWNDAQVQFARVSRAHSLYLLMNNFICGIEEERSGGPKPNLGKQEVNVMVDLAKLFGLRWIEEDIGGFLEDGYMSAEQAKWVRSGVMVMLDKVRPNAVGLVDARDVSDFRLKSALGRKDGDVYPAILASSKRDPLNGTEPGPGYEEHLKRLIVDGVGVYTGTASRL